MKTLFQKTIAGGLATICLLIFFAPASLAQNDGLFDETLNPIKAEVEKSGIEVIEFGAAKTNPWGNVPPNIISILMINGLTSLDSFGVTGDAAKKQEELENIKQTLGEIPEIQKLILTSVSRDTLDEIANLIYQEAKFQKTQQKWGNLPEQVIQILSDQGHSDLQAVATASGYDQTYDGSIKLNEFLSNIEGLYAKDQDGNKMITTVNKGTDLERSVTVLNQFGIAVQSEIIYQGESQLQAVILAAAKVFRNVLGSLAIVFIIIAGIQMVFAQGDETKITEQKHAITWAVVGLLIIIILERLINAIYGVPGEIRALTPGTALQVQREIYGLISYIKAILGSAAVFMVILSGVKTIAAQGEDEKLKTQRKAIVWTIIGIVLILINQVVVENIYIKPAQAGGQITQENVSTILSVFGTVVNSLLGLGSLFVFAALVYGAGSMVVNYGNEELTQRAKKIAKNAAIGFVIILSAFAIVNTVIL